MKVATQHQTRLGGRRVDYRVMRSRAARKLRVRVGPNGVEVVQPTARDGEDVSAFLDSNKAWILDQLQRVDRLRNVRRPVQRRVGVILFRGELTQVRVETTETRGRGNIVDFIDGEIVVRRGAESQTPAARGLENWLRKQARAEIEKHLAITTTRIRQNSQRLYIMGQRTKWGNCSPERNLSFNWRLILAPEFVLRYLVTHEAVHLVVPDHSSKFWLTVQSLCPETEKAKQWLCRHQAQLTVDLGSVVKLATGLSGRANARGAIVSRGRGHRRISARALEESTSDHDWRRMPL
ncbi:SprT family zinc-dependent metalloprotease [Candidatus Methylomirabilis sp.]|uniref:M48 family metallopeptidase n=1 Tax=Candidatus Methylomirabilis sp. TaxID=2032687 RepID=UPI002A60D50E|nr:SprT family zinc-dependent metalloprotease [Candidatus Methylomirabilis sp.]